MECSCSNISGSLIQDSSFPISQWRDGGGGFGWVLSWPSSENHESQRNLHGAHGNSGRSLSTKPGASFLLLQQAKILGGASVSFLPGYATVTPLKLARAKALHQHRLVSLFVAHAALGNLVLSLPVVLGSLASCILQGHTASQGVQLHGLHGCRATAALASAVPEGRNTCWRFLFNRRSLLKAAGSQPSGVVYCRTPSMGL